MSGWRNTAEPSAVNSDCGTTTTPGWHVLHGFNWVDPSRAKHDWSRDELVLHADVAFLSTYFAEQWQNRIDGIKADLNKYMEEMEAGIFAGTQSKTSTKERR